MGHPLAKHAACPMLRGTKWVAIKWYREAPYNVTCWEATESLSGDEGGQPATANMRRVAWKLGRRMEHCRQSDLGKSLPAPLEIPEPASLRIFFGKLSFKRCLGRGTMGEAVLASWRRKEVAAKVIAPEFSPSVPAVEDFAREAHILGPL